MLELSDSVSRRKRSLFISTDLKYLGEVRGMVRSTCQRCRIEADAEAIAKSVDELELAVTELVSNVVRHGFDGRPGGRLEVDTCVENGVFAFCLTHDGKPFNGNSAAIPEITDPQEGGMGLFLISRCVDSILYSKTADGLNQIQILKTLSTTTTTTEGGENDERNN